MSNPLTNWWRSFQFSKALQKGNIAQTQQILEKIQSSGVRLSLLQRTFKDKFQSEQHLKEYEREVIVLREQIASVSRTLEERHQEIAKLLKQVGDKRQEVSLVQLKLEQLQQQNKLNQPSNSLFKELLIAPNHDFVKFVENQFRLNQLDANLLQCTDLNKELFYALEENLANYLKSEFAKYQSQPSFWEDLRLAHEDIEVLKKGRDPQYDSYLSPHIYFTTYFLEGVYSAYIAWFLVYQSGLFKAKANLLDIGAGSGAMIYGLNLFLKSAETFDCLSQSHICYCSLERRNFLQHHGLELWKQYIEPQLIDSLNTYFRFKTVDILSYTNGSNNSGKLPKKFFDFITISHCIFSDQVQRVNSHKIYKKIFDENLQDNGYVLVVVQGRRLFSTYGFSLTENQAEEERLIQGFVKELGLKLEWYKYLTSTGKRTPSGGAEFAKFARENLPPNRYLSPLRRQYLGQKYDSNYVLDDYVILAKKQ